MLRRVGRHLFTILAVLSLLMCVATVVLIAVVHLPSNTITIGLRGTQMQRPITFYSHAFRTKEFSILGQGGFLSLMAVPHQYTAGAAPSDFSRRRDGPLFRDTYVNGQIGWQVLLPYPWVLLATGALPSIWIWRYVARRSSLLRDRNLKPAKCRVCGYDLRAHNAGERCPECGTAVA